MTRRGFLGWLWQASKQMATPYLVAEFSDEFRMHHAIPHEYGGELYIRLYKGDSASFHEFDRITVFKSSDSGVTWAEQSTAGGPNPSLFATFVPGCGVVSGGVLYIAYCRRNQSSGFPSNPAMTSTLAIARFDFGSGSWLSDWSGPNSYRYTLNPQLGLRSDGSFVCQFQGTDLGGAGGTDRRKWMYCTISSSGTFSSEADLTTSWQTWGFVTNERQYGNIAIGSDDSAHFFYGKSASGSSSGDVSAIHQRLSSAGVLSGETIVASPFMGAGLLTWPNAVGVAVSGVDSVVKAAADWDGAFDYDNAVLYGAATAAPASSLVQSPSADVSLGTWLANIGNDVYVAMADSTDMPSSSKQFGVRLATFTGGAFGATDITVHDGSGSPDWNWLTANALGSSAIGFVLEDWNTEDIYFMRHPIGGGGPAGRNRYYAF